MENSSNSGSHPPQLPSDAELWRIAYAAVAAIVARRDWTFLAEVEIRFLAEQVFRELKQQLQEGKRGDIVVLADQSALALYSEAWVAGLRANGTIDQVRGYESLSDYLGGRLPSLIAKRNTKLAEDRNLLAQIRQEIIFKVQAQLYRLENPRTFTPWLLRVANTVIRDHLTALLSDALLYSTDIEQEAETHLAESPVRYIYNNPPLLSQLRRILEKCLNDALRLQIIEAIFLEELEIHEIAARLGMDPKTVSQEKFRALQKLRRCGDLLDFLEDLS